MNKLVFLQNAWSPLYAGGIWPRASWLRALVRSRSGQRLRLLLDDLNCCENTTPLTGLSSSSQLPPDYDYIRLVLKERADKQTIIVTCGEQARGALVNLWAGALLAIPHPASRLLTTELYIAARQLLSEFSPGLRLRIAQGRNGPLVSGIEKHHCCEHLFEGGTSNEINSRN